MKVVILAGGLGTRISEETETRPKPMVEIGGRPLLWHILKIYAHHNMTDFIICCGYKGYMIKEYFANYFLHISDVTFDLKNNSIEILEQKSEPWKITLVDTGEHTATGGRLKKIAKYLDADADFCLTYGDGVADIDLTALVKFHKSHQKLATVTAVTPPGRFGAIDMDGDTVTGFSEKPTSGEGKINGGFFVISPKCLDLIEGDQSAWEKEPMAYLTARRELKAFEHNAFWQPMDTLREKRMLEDMWQNDAAPWKVWD